MKKLTKLVISPEKIMKNEELINLQGGYAGICCTRSNGSESHKFCHHSDSVMYSWVQAWISLGWNVSCDPYYIA